MDEPDGRSVVDLATFLAFCGLGIFCLVVGILGLFKLVDLLAVSVLARGVAGVGLGTLLFLLARLFVLSRASE